MAIKLELNRPVLLFHFFWRRWGRTVLPLVFTCLGGESIVPFPLPCCLGLFDSCFVNCTFFEEGVLAVVVADEEREESEEELGVGEVELEAEEEEEVARVTLPGVQLLPSTQTMSASLSSPSSALPSTVVVAEEEEVEVSVMRGAT